MSALRLTDRLIGWAATYAALFLVSLAMFIRIVADSFAVNLTAPLGLA